MSKNQKQPTKNNSLFVMERRNYQILFVGLAFLVLGFILMSGGGSDDPKVFNEAIYNFRRIRLAPMLVLIGLGIQVFAILHNPSKKD